jgi:hypothetical protein
MQNMSNHGPSDWAIETPRFKRSIWGAFGFTASIVVISLVAMPFSGVTASLPALLSFLPMSFFFVAAPMSKLREEILFLKNRVRELEANAVASTDQAS